MRGAAPGSARTRCRMPQTVRVDTLTYVVAMKSISVVAAEGTQVEQKHWIHIHVWQTCEGGLTWVDSKTTTLLALTWASVSGSDMHTLIPV